MVHVRGLILDKKTAMISKKQTQGIAGAFYAKK